MSYWKDFKYFCRRVVGFPKKVFTWLPIIWKTEDYDYNFTLILMKFHLGLVRKHIAEHQIHTNWRSDVKKIKIAENLLDRMTGGQHVTIYYCYTVKERLGYKPDVLMRSPYQIENDDWKYFWNYMNKYMRKWWC